MQNPVAMLFVSIAVIGAIGSNIVFRFASQHSGWNWLYLFAIGIAIGFCVPLFVTLALARGNANVVFALLSGFSCGGLQIAAYFFFREALDPWQIIGIVMICIGAVLVSISSTNVLPTV